MLYRLELGPIRVVMSSILSGRVGENLYGKNKYR